MHQEETASGISVDMSEIQVLLEELVGKEESLNKVGDTQSKQLKEDKSKTEDIRQKAFRAIQQNEKAQVNREWWLMRRETQAPKEKCSHQMFKTNVI